MSDNLLKQSRTEALLVGRLVALGLKPQAQYQISMCRVDIAFPKQKLVIEIDGPYHDSEEQKERDFRRDIFLNKEGWKVLRYKASTVHDHAERVAWKIQEKLKTLSTGTEIQNRQASISRRQISLSDPPAPLELEDSIYDISKEWVDFKKIFLVVCAIFLLILIFKF